MQYPTKRVRVPWSRPLAVVRSALTALCLLACAPALATAQEVFGALSLAESGRPAPGVVVLALRASDNAVVARTVTGERGNFWLRIPTDSVHLRALRIGQEPTTIAELRLRVGESRNIRAELPLTPIAIASLRARADNRCHVRPDSALAVARVYDQVRTALLSSVLESLDGRPRVRYRITNEVRTLSDSMVEVVHTAQHTSDSAAVFRSVPADSLTTVGFVSRQLDGTTIYRAPDALVLTDDRFLASYCLKLADAAPDHSEWIGVAFEPSRTRYGVTPIRGTMWLDRKSAELRRIDFEHVGLGRMLERARPGGFIEYAQLPNGYWFANRWEIRMPRVQSRVTLNWARGSRILDDPESSESVTGIHTIAGEVSDVFVGLHPQYTAGRDDLVDPSGAVIAAPLDSFSDPGSCPVTAHSPLLLYGSAIATHPHGTSPVRVNVRWHRSELPDARGHETQLRTAVADSFGRFRVCGLPRGVPVLVEAAGEAHDTARVILNAGPTQITARVDLMLRPTMTSAMRDADWDIDHSGTDVLSRALDSTLVLRASAPGSAPRSASMLQVRDSVSGEPLALARVAVGSAAPQLTDEAGNVLVPDSSLRSLDVRVQRIGFRAFAGTATRVNSRDAFVVRLARVPPSLDTVAVVANTRARSIVRVLDANGVPIPFAQVSIGGGRPYATDVSGRVALSTALGASAALNVRRVGYSPHAAEVALSDSTGEFVVTLNPIAATVEAVRTIAERSTPLSRTGFYDRMNRVRNGAMVGSFITPEELELRGHGSNWWDVLRSSQYVTIGRGGPLGRGGCLMQVVVDGAIAAGRELSPSEIMAIEVYPSTANAPAELIPLTNRGSCGIIAVWTGPRR